MNRAECQLRRATKNDKAECQLTGPVSRITRNNQAECKQNLSGADHKSGGPERDRSGSSLNFDARHISFLFRGSRCRGRRAGSGGCLRLRRVCRGSCWRRLLCCLCRAGVGVCLLPACARVARSCASVSGLLLRVLLLPVLDPSFVFLVFSRVSAVFSGFRFSEL